MYDLNRIEKKNICIMGLMGSGKSIIGKDLSKYLNFQFYDTDKEIELQTKKSIKNIFEENGESYLQVKLNNLLLRLKSSKKRPLLNNNQSKIEILKNLYKDRRKFYEKADFIINNDNDKIRVLEKIKTELNSYAK